jgi:hypothetical protein
MRFDPIGVAAAACLLLAGAAQAANGSVAGAMPRDAHDAAKRAAAKRAAQAPCEIRSKTAGMLCEAEAPAKARRT